MPTTKQRVFLGAFLVLLSGIAPPRSRAQIGTQAPAAASPTEHPRYDPAGLSLLHPYSRGKMPVIFVHGLWSDPASWHRMIATLEADPAIGGRYQFWTFGYSTGDPIPYSAYLLRKALDDLRRRCDPGGSDAAFDRMVVVGHSMGGLIARMLATDAGDRLWRVVSDRPFGELQGGEDDRALFRDGLFFVARPEVRRVIYIATPHRGSRLDRGTIRYVGARLIRVADPLRAAHRRLVSCNDPAFFRGHFRKAIPTSIEELEWGSPILTGLAELPTAAGVRVHSIIAALPGPPTGEPTDGLVTYASAHVAGAASELVVTAGHLCQDHPQVIGEVRRILAEHATH